MKGTLEEASVFAFWWLVLLIAWVVLLPLSKACFFRFRRSDIPWIAIPLEVIRRSLGFLTYLALGAMTWIFLTWRDSGPWAMLTGSDVEPSTSDLLPVAAALLALLLFAANFLHGISKHDGTSAKYLGEPVDRYLSVHSWPMEFISGNLFRAVTLLLFIIPLTLDWWPLRVFDSWNGGLLAVSLWSACFIVVGLTLIFSLLSVLRSSGTLLRSRDYVKFRIHDDLQSTSRRRIQHLARQDQDIAEDTEYWCGHHLSVARSLPPEEHTAYLRATVTSTEYHWVQNSLRDESLRWSRRWEGRSRRIITRLQDLNLGRWKAVSKALSDDSLAPEIRKELVRLLRNMARAVDAIIHGNGETSFPEFLKRELLRKPSLTPASTYRTPFILVPEVGADENPVSMITYVCFREFIRTSLPSGAPSRCGIEDLRAWIDTCENLNHQATRKAVCAELIDAILCSAVTERNAEETLPQDVLAQLHHHYGGSRIQKRGEPTSVQRSLSGAAFRAVVGSPSLEPEKLRHLLAVLRSEQKHAALLYVLQYRHRAGQPVSPECLKPFAEAFMDSRIGIEDIPVGPIVQYLKNWIPASAISHLLSPGDVDWLVNILTIEQGYETVHSYIRYQGGRGLRDFPLRELLLWRYIAGPIDPYLFVETPGELLPGLTEREQNRIREQVASAASTLEWTDDELYSRYQTDFWPQLHDFR